MQKKYFEIYCLPAKYAAFKPFQAAKAGPGC